MKRQKAGRRYLKGIAAVLILAALLTGITGCVKKIDAKGYVQADLDLIFQGETEGAKKFLDASDSELFMIYENGIRAFAENYLIGGLDTGGTLAEGYTKLLKEVFQTMRYRVEAEEETGKDTWEVTVSYCPVNVFTTFIPELQKESEQIEKDAADGKYKGTDEERLEAMLIDYMNHSYELLEMAYLGMEYGEEAEFIFTVTRDDKGGPAMDEEEINTFIERILALDKL